MPRADQPAVPPTDDDQPPAALASHDTAPREGRSPWPSPPTWSVDSFDSAAEVDAVFRTQRRVAVGYAAIFGLVLLSVSLLAVTLGWWTAGRVAGGMSPGFLVAALGLYIAFVSIAVAASLLASAVENRMLGSAETLWRDDPPTGRDPAGEPGVGDDEARA